MKHLVFEDTVQTGDMYGFSNIVIALTQHNLEELKRLRETFAKIKAIDSSIYNATIYQHSLDIQLFNDGFDLEEFNEENELPTDNYVIDITEEQVEKFADEDGDYKIDGDLIRVSEYGITVVYLSKWTSDEVWVEFSFDTFEKNFEKSLVV